MAGSLTMMMTHRRIVSTQTGKNGPNAVNPVVEDQDLGLEVSSRRVTTEAQNAKIPRRSRLRTVTLRIVLWTA